MGEAWSHDIVGAWIRAFKSQTLGTAILHAQFACRCKKIVAVACYSRYKNPAGRARDMAKSAYDEDDCGLIVQSFHFLYQLLI